MVYGNPYIPVPGWYNPLYNPTNHVVFIAQVFFRHPKMLGQTAWEDETPSD